MLIRLIYASYMTRPIEKKDLEQILHSARDKNLVQGVTGMLCFGNNRFLQCLEGSSKSAHTIYERILEDPRHDKIVLIEDKEIDRRIFGDWSMGSVDMDDIGIKVMVRETIKSDEFLPETLDAATALHLFKTFKSSLSDQVILD